MKAETNLMLLKRYAALEEKYQIKIERCIQNCDFMGLIIYTFKIAYIRAKYFQLAMTSVDIKNEVKK